MNLSGNAWKKVPINYTLTANSVLCFEVYSDDEGEILAIGLDENNVFNDATRIFQLGGAHSGSPFHENFKNYTEGSGWRRYNIPVGDFYIGAMSDLFFVADDDGDGSTNVKFRNIRLFESDNQNKYFYTYSEFDSYSRVLRTSQHWRPAVLDDDLSNKLHYGWLSFGLENTYDSKSTLLETQDASGHIWWSAPVANQYGQTESFRMNNNKLITEYDYDADNRTLTDVRTGTSGQNGTSYSPTSLQDMDFLFDVLGNFKSRTDHKISKTETFTYDHLNRLKTSSVGGGTTVSVTYNDIGNILSKSDIGSYTYSSSNPHQVTAAGGKTYAYDANGNMTTFTGGTVTWKAFNKPEKITKGTNSSEFTYDANHNRITHQVKENGANKKRIIYGGGVEQEETYQNGEWKTNRTRIYTAGGVYTHHADDTIERHYLLKDHLRSTVAVVKASDNSIVESYSFDAWGKKRNAQTWAAVSGHPVDDGITDRGFTGHEMLDEVGLVHMNGRIYDAELGRFLSADPHVQFPDNLQNYNRYSYVNNNPLSYTDPSGYFISGLFKSVRKFVKKYWKTIVTIAIAAALIWIGPFSGIITSKFWAGVANGALAGAVSGGVGAALHGGNVFKGALYGGISGAAFGAVGGGDAFFAKNFGDFARVAKIAAHGVTGGVMSEMRGGEFMHGFYAAAMAQAFAPEISEYLPGSEIEDVAMRTVAASIVGGTASEITGGGFENGAITGAFSRLFNDESHFLMKVAKELNPFNSQGSFAKQAVSMTDTMGALAAKAWAGITDDDNLAAAAESLMTDSYADSAFGQTKNADGWAKYGTRGAFGVAAVGAAGASFVLGGEILASKGFFTISNHVGRQIGANGARHFGAQSRYWSESFVRSTFSNVSGRINFAGSTPIKNLLTTARYPINGGEVVRNIFTNKIVHYLPY